MVVGLKGADSPDFIEVTNALYKKFTDALKEKALKFSQPMMPQNQNNTKTGFAKKVAK